MLKRIIDFQIKYSKLLFVFFLSVIIASAYIGSNLQINSDFSTLIPSDSQYNTNDRILNNAFEQNDGLVLSIALDQESILNNRVYSLDDQRVENYIEQISDSLVESSYVLGVSPPVYSDDLTVAQVFVSMQTPNKIGAFQDVLDELNSIVEEVGEPAGVNAQVTGFPVLLDRVATLLIQDNLKTIVITVVFIFLILYWYSRDLTFTLITMTTPVVSLIFLAATLVLLNIPITITLAAVGVLTLGLGADYGIHIAIHYNKARQEHEGHREALHHTINELKLPITASFLTTFAGFVALLFGVSPSSQAQGIVLAIRKAREELGFKNIKITLPLCRTQQDLKEVLSILEGVGLSRGHDGLEIVMSCSTPANIVLLDKLLHSVDGVSVDLNHLSNLILGVDSSLEIDSFNYDANDEAVKELLLPVIHRCNERNKSFTIYGDISEDMLSFLIEHNVQSISVSSKVISKTSLDIEKLEHTLSKKTSVFKPGFTISVFEKEDTSTQKKTEKKITKKPLAKKSSIAKKAPAKKTATKKASPKKVAEKKTTKKTGTSKKKTTTKKK